MHGDNCYHFVNVYKVLVALLRFLHIVHLNGKHNFDIVRDTILIVWTFLQIQ